MNWLLNPLDETMNLIGKDQRLSMLAICFGIFTTFSLFAFFLIWGALVMAGRADEAETRELSKKDKKIGREVEDAASVRLDPELVPEKASR